MSQLACPFLRISFGCLSSRAHFLGFPWNVFARVLMSLLRVHMPQEKKGSYVPIRIAYRSCTRGKKRRSSFAISIGTPKADPTRLAACLARFRMVGGYAFYHWRAWRRVRGVRMSLLSTRQVDAQRVCSCCICGIFVVNCLEKSVQRRDDCF